MDRNKRYKYVVVQCLRFKNGNISLAYLMPLPALITDASFTSGIQYAATFGHYTAAKLARHFNATCSKPGKLNFYILRTE